MQFIKAKIELDAGGKSFATGLLPELIAALTSPCRRPNQTVG
jgi:hypothetical protein